MSTKRTVADHPAGDSAAEQRGPAIGRRRFLQAAATQGAVAAVAVGAAAGSPPAAAQTAAPAAARVPLIAREFHDPYVELLRLLKEAAEVEHALMLQYLYGAFSLKPRYRALRGTGTPNANDLLGIAVQEMMHLGQVNRLLVTLGGAPSLMAQDFPYEPDIYPFEFTLEPLSRHSLAKYIYAEAPAGALPASPELAREIDQALGRDMRVNHVGSLYDAILRLLGELEAEAQRAPLPRDIDFRYWRTQLARIKNEGEADHFRFFRSVFAGTHAAFGAQTQAVWLLPPTAPEYPALMLPKNPSAFELHANRIAEPRARRLAWLGNLQYWTVLCLLTYGYKAELPAYTRMAQAHMQGPMLVLASALAERGAGMPFEQLSMGYAPALDDQYFLLRMLRETQAEEAALKADLPADYPAAVTTATLEELTDVWNASRRVQEFRRRG